MVLLAQDIDLLVADALRDLNVLASVGDEQPCAEVLELQPIHLVDVDYEAHPQWERPASQRLRVSSARPLLSGRCARGFASTRTPGRCPVRQLDVQLHPIPPAKCPR